MEVVTYYCCLCVERHKGSYCAASVWLSWGIFSIFTIYLRKENELLLENEEMLGYYLVVVCDLYKFYLLKYIKKRYKLITFFNYAVCSN